MSGRPRLPSATTLSPTLMLVLMGLAVVAPAQADRIQLRDGSKLKGALLDDLQNSASVRMMTENSVRPLVFPREQIIRVTPEPDLFDDYFAIRDRYPQTAQGQFELGQWCEQEGLSGLARLQFEAAVELDKDHAEAQKKLGRVLHEGAWISHDDLKRDQGLIFHDGHWISAEELALKQSMRSETAVHANWTRRLDLIRRRLKAGPAEDRQLAESELFAIDDPAAVSAMLEVFGREEPALRAMLVRRLAAAAWPEALQGLARLALVETEATLWDQVMDALAARPDPEISRFFVASLDIKNPSQVGRAARALSRLKTRAAVPALINALVKVERRFVPVPVAGQPVGPGAPSPNPGYTGLIGQAYVANVEPVVGEGVVAYRPIVGLAGSGVATGGGGFNSQPMTPTISLPRPVSVYYPNKEVLAALEELTGRNFGYDKAAWNRWIKTSFRVEQEPRRKVLEP